MMVKGLKNMSRVMFLCWGKEKKQVKPAFLIVFIERCSR
jgi:hypothetical protein